MVKRKVYKAFPTQLVAFFAAVTGSYPFGLLSDHFAKGNIAGGTGWSDTAGFNGIYVFGFYLGLFFCISFAHFAFVKSPSRYYYITISLLLLTSLILIELFWLAVGFTVVGILAGSMTSQAIKYFEAKTK